MVLVEASKSRTTAPLALWPAVAAVILLAGIYVLRLETLLPVAARATPTR